MSYSFKYNIDLKLIRLNPESALSEYKRLYANTIKLLPEELVWGGFCIEKQGNEFEISMLNDGDKPAAHVFLFLTVFQNLLKYFRNNGLQSYIIPTIANPAGVEEFELRAVTNYLGSDYWTFDGNFALIWSNDLSYLLPREKLWDKVLPHGKNTIKKIECNGLLIPFADGSGMVWGCRKAETEWITSALQLNNSY